MPGQILTATVILGPAPPPVPVTTGTPVNAECRGGALGTAPLGSVPFGSEWLGGIVSVVASVSVTGVQTIQVITAPLALVVGLNPATWVVARVGGAEVYAVTLVTALAPLGQLWLITVSPAMLPTPEQYTLALSSGAPGEFCGSYTFDGPPPPPEVRLAGIERGREPYDIANPFLVRDAGIHDPPPLGQYQINDRGDVALDDRIQGLRKRILRRLSTFRGGFFHLPEYGAARGIKDPFLVGTLTALAAEIRMQVQREPEVLRAQVSMEQSPNSPFVLIVTVRARTIRGLDVSASQTLDLRPTSNATGGG
jgi:hypothetical protein